MNNKKRNGKINIKSKNSIITRKNVLIVIAALLLAIISSVVSIKYVFFKISHKELKELNNQSGINVEVVAEKHIKNIISEVGPSLVSVGSNLEDLESHKLPSNNSTGVILTKDGLIMIPYSSIKDYKKIYVKLPAKGVKPKKATLLGYNKETDTALIKVQCNDLVPIKISNDTSIREGSIVYAVGNSIGANYIGLRTPGIVTSTSHRVKVYNEDYKIIQTNAAMNNENYGGVLCNVYGELIGINSKYLTKKYDEDNLFFAISSDAIKDITKNIVKEFDVLGLRGSEIKIDNIQKKGFYIESLDENGKAAKAGIRPTDIILLANNKPILSYDDLIKDVKNSDNKNKVELQILRDGKTKKIYIVM